MLRVYTGVYIPRNVYVTSLTIAKYRRTVRCTDARARVCVRVYVYRHYRKGSKSNNSSNRKNRKKLCHAAFLFHPLDRR